MEEWKQSFAFLFSCTIGMICLCGVLALDIEYSKILFEPVALIIYGICLVISLIVKGFYKPLWISTFLSPLIAIIIMVKATGESSAFIGLVYFVLIIFSFPAALIIGILKLLFKNRKNLHFGNPPSE